MNPSGIDANESVTHRRSGPMRRIHLQHYALAILSVGAALGASLVLNHFQFRVPSSLLLLFAVAISSWYGGRGPAVLAAALSIISFYWYFTEPVRTPYIYFSQIPFFIIFVGFAALLSWFGTVRRRVEADLRQSRDMLREQASLLNLTYEKADSRLPLESQGRFPALRLAVIYAFFGALWIALSDRLSFYIVSDLRLAERLQTYKGWFFIAVTSVLLWSLAKRFLSQVGAAEEALHSLNRKLQAISNCNQSLLRATDEQSLLQEICRIVWEEAGYRMAWVGYAEHDEAKSVRPVAWTGAEEGYLATIDITWADTERGRGPTGTAIRTGRSCCIQDFATDPRIAPWRESVLRRDFRSGIALPLKDEHDNALGSLTIYSAQPNAFTPEEVRLLEELAGDLAFGIVTLRSRAARKRAEAELRRSEAYLAESQRLTRTGSWALDVARDKYIYCSEQCLRIYGFDPQGELPTREAVFRLVVPEDLDKVTRSVEKSIHEKVDSSDEVRIQLPDGTVKQIFASRHPVLNDAGDVVELVGTSVDITERKRAEEALRESETRFRTFWDHAADAFSVLDEQHRVIDVNREACENHGYTREEMIGVGPQAFDPDLDAARLQWIDERIAAGEICTFETRNRRKDGTVFPVEVRVRPLQLGGRRFHLASARDITERKRAEEALRDNEIRFRTFVDHTADAFFMLDFEQGTIIDVNRPACESLGYNRQELIGMTPLAFDMNLDHAAFKSTAGRTAAGETVLFERHWHRRKDGSQFPVEVHTSAFWHGGRHFLLKVARDISDRVRAEEQREKLRELETDLAHINRVSMMGELAASIAHEVNQPLTGIVSNASASLRFLAGDAPNLEEVREAVSDIVRDGKRAGEIIARIRALTKRTAAAREKLALNETIREVLALVDDEAKSNGVMVRTHFADDLSPVAGDRVQLQQVTLNLVMNAIEAMSSICERPRELVITTRNVDADQVQVTVEDSGMGLAPNTIEKIFDSFYTTKSGGMGMGLSISRSILQAHGGRLWATAKDSPGTIFHFTVQKYHEEGAHAGATGT